jgi:proteasome lid subunit RPN8/RPN11
MLEIQIGEGSIQEMIQHSKSESPNEACGILAGSIDGDLVRATEVYRCENVHPNPTMEFFLKPEDQLRVFLELEGRKEADVVGFYHSHPRGPSSPSQIDASKNYWPDYPMAIVALVPEPEVSFWKWKDGGYHPLEMLRERF